MVSIQNRTMSSYKSSGNDNHKQYWVEEPFLPRRLNQKAYSTSLLIEQVEEMAYNFKFRPKLFEWRRNSQIYKQEYYESSSMNRVWSEKYAPKSDHRNRHTKHHAEEKHTKESTISNQSRQHGQYSGDEENARQFHSRTLHDSGKFSDIRKPPPKKEMTTELKTANSKHCIIPDDRTTSTEKQYRCKTCPEVYYHVGDLISHAKIHLSAVPFQCSKCKSCFPSSDHLNRHVKIHTNEKHSGFSVSQSKELKLQNEKELHHSHTSHIEIESFNETQTKDGSIITDGRDEPSCERNICLEQRHNERKYKSEVASDKPGTTTDHEMTETEKPLRCKVCPRIYHQVADLISHAKSHLTEVPFQCTICKRCFPSSDHLNRHEKRHNEEPSLCESKGNNAETPENHTTSFVEEIVTEYNPKTIDHNEQSSDKRKASSGETPDMIELNVPSNKPDNNFDHETERPYRCKLCPKSYFHANHLRSHVRIHAREIPLKCSAFRKCSPSTDNLNQHMKDRREENNTENAYSSHSKENIQNKGMKRHFPEISDETESKLFNDRSETIYGSNNIDNKDECYLAKKKICLEE